MALGCACTALHLQDFAGQKKDHQPCKFAGWRHLADATAGDVVANATPFARQPSKVWGAPHQHISPFVDQHAVPWALEDEELASPSNRVLVVDD